MTPALLSRRSATTLAALAMMAIAAVPPAGGAERVREVAVEVRDEAGRRPRSIAIEDIRIFEGETEKEVLGIRPLARGDWHVLVYVDAFATRGSELEEASQLLAEMAERLVALGPVTLVVADELTEPWLEEETAAEEVRQALLEV
ncbi:MAG: hypothetical protein R3190_13070, partial [Thermoanaerobaculia bacterium]|nr:hypothetical protein [Thermoanaerobaculia bacterium]